MARSSGASGTSPAAGSGPVTVYAGAVDGNGGAGTAVNDQDPTGDDTVQATIVIPERGAQSVSGCSMGGSDSRVSVTVFALILVMVVFKRERSRRGRYRERVEATCPDRR